jgi:ABC transporter with metal-binding/Fe-S-binding domain ATP-binding protein
MKLAILFSGGKDSCYAMHLARQHHEIACLITIQSKNPESYMFHTPNINMTELQAEAIGLPLLTVKTEGEKEKELSDLKKAIKRSIELFEVEGIVTGAIESVYQATRVQNICDELNLWCFNPLWQKDQMQLLNELLTGNFEIIISSIAAYPFDEKWLGRKLDEKTVHDLKSLHQKYKINPAGEGGEYESLVTYAPFFSKKIIIKSAEKKIREYSGVYMIKEAALV